MSSGTWHYTQGEQEIEAAKRLLAKDTQDAIAAATIAAAHFAAALAAATAEAGRLTTNTTTPGIKPSEWWTALHGEERP